MFVMFPDEEKISVGDLEKYAKTMVNNDVPRGIIVIKGEITKKAKEAIDKIADNIYIEIFNQQDLIINITEHEMVPLHLLVNDDDKKLLLKK